MATAVIEPAAVTANLKLIRRLLQPETEVLAVVKADAYGHGATRIVPALERAGVRRFATATAEELLEVREAGSSADLMLLTPALDRFGELFAAGAVFTLSDADALERLVRAGVPRGTRVHLKVDTGMGRLGVRPAAAAELAAAAGKAGLEVEGVYTHFADAEADRALTGRQLEEFLSAVELMERHGIRVRYRHAANSAALLNHPEAHLDMVRPGLLLYGYSPLPATPQLPGRLAPALRLEAPVLARKRIRKGQGLSYGHVWHAPADTDICTVRCGYADGYRRSLGNRAHAVWNGHELPQRGRIAMDQLLVEARGPGPVPGDLVTLFGGDAPGADELGALCGTNAYDLLTSLTRRVRRRYVGTDD